MTPLELEALIDMVEADYEAMEQHEDRTALLRSYLASEEGDWTDAVCSLIDMGV